MTPEQLAEIERIAKNAKVKAEKVIPEQPGMYRVEILAMGYKPDGFNGKTHFTQYRILKATPTKTGYDPHPVGSVMSYVVNKLDQGKQGVVNTNKWITHLARVFDFKDESEAFANFASIYGKQAGAYLLADVEIFHKAIPAKGDLPARNDWAEARWFTVPDRDQRTGEELKSLRAAANLPTL